MHATATSPRFERACSTSSQWSSGSWDSARWAAAVWRRNAKSSIVTLGLVNIYLARGQFPAELMAVWGHSPGPLIESRRLTAPLRLAYLRESLAQEGQACSARLRRQTAVDEFSAAALQQLAIAQSPSHLAESDSTIWLCIAAQLHDLSVRVRHNVSTSAYPDLQSFCAVWGLPVRHI